MAEIKIPFNDWSRDKLKKGIKTATSRTKRYGDVGDTFTIDGKKYLIEYLKKVPLRAVANIMYEIEGAESKEEFIQIWKEIHPRKGFVPDQEVWFHRFKILDAFFKCPDCECKIKTVYCENCGEEIEIDKITPCTL